MVSLPEEKIPVWSYLHGVHNFFSPTLAAPTPLGGGRHRRGQATVVRHHLQDRSLHVSLYGQSQAFFPSSQVRSVRSQTSLRSRIMAFTFVALQIFGITASSVLSGRPLKLEIISVAKGPARSSLTTAQAPRPLNQFLSCLP
jgi:hypothetical protein